MRLGMGQAVLVVPQNVCVASKAEVGAGAVDVFGESNAGVDVDWADKPRATRKVRRVVVDADVGFGALLVRHDRRDVGDHTDRPGRTGGRGPFDYIGAGNTGCANA